MISIILNSRNRVEKLTQLLSSIASTTENIDNIEVLVNIDDDDISSLSSLDFLKDMYSFASFFVGERPVNLHKNLNKLLRHIRGSVVIVVNDDVKFLTDKWDIILLEEISKAARKYDDRYFYLVSKDNSADKEGNKAYPSFPILTKSVIDSLEYIMPEKFVGLGADVYLYRMFDHLHRLVNVDISFDHIYHSTIEAVVNPDTTAADMRANTYKNYINPWTCDIREDATKISESIARTKIKNNIARSVSE